MTRKYQKEMKQGEILHKNGGGAAHNHPCQAKTLNRSPTTNLDRGGQLGDDSNLFFSGIILSSIRKSKLYSFKFRSQVNSFKWEKYFVYSSQILPLSVALPRSEFQKKQKKKQEPFLIV